MNDSMGGYDPYSASKGCAELITSSYSRSFFGDDGIDKSPNALIASARAGNVIGGGDWAKDRLVPDVIRSLIGLEPIMIRNPEAVRPWQHVLDPLSGYLLLAEKLASGNSYFAEGWNFGPEMSNTRSVKMIVEQLVREWDDTNAVIDFLGTQEPHEANLLSLDISKAQMKLGWKPTWDYKTVISKTVNWYKRQLSDDAVRLSIEHIHDFERDMKY